MRRRHAKSKQCERPLLCTARHELPTHRQGVFMSLRDAVGDLFVPNGPPARRPDDEERATPCQAARLSAQRLPTPVRSSTPVSVALLRPGAALSPVMRTSLEHLHRFARGRSSGHVARLVGVLTPPGNVLLARLTGTPHPLAASCLVGGWAPRHAMVSPSAPPVRGASPPGGVSLAGDPLLPIACHAHSVPRGPPVVKAKPVTDAS
jgi:hypothetical protein